MQPSWIATAIVVTSLAARSQTPVGPFTGEESEDFSGPQQVNFATCLQYRVFEDTADVCTPSGMGCHTIDFQTFACTIVAQSAPYFFCSVQGAVEISFDFDVERFGGWFGTNTFFPDAAVDFFDDAGNPIASVTASIPADCSWNWQGWDFGPSSTVRRVLISGSPIFGSGFIDLDDLQVDYAGVLPPRTYCTAGTTSNGCNASISATGTASASATSGFTLSVSGVEGQKQGIVFYGINGRAAAPWGTGSSVLCVKAPTQRMTISNSGGSLGLCDGTLNQDWLAFVASNPSALGAPFMAGAVVDAQAWFRDPPSPKTTNLSNGVEFTVLP